MSISEGPSTGFGLFARSVHSLLSEFCILSLLRTSYSVGAKTADQKTGRGREHSSNGKLNSGFRRRAALTKWPHQSLGYCRNMIWKKFHVTQSSLFGEFRIRSMSCVLRPLDESKRAWRFRTG